MMFTLLFLGLSLFLTGMLALTGLVLDNLLPIAFLPVFIIIGLPLLLLFWPVVLLFWPVILLLCAPLILASLLLPII